MCNIKELKMNAIVWHFRFQKKWDSDTRKNCWSWWYFVLVNNFLVKSYIIMHSSICSHSHFSLITPNLKSSFFSGIIVDLFLTKKFYNTLNLQIETLKKVKSKLLPSYFLRIRDKAWLLWSIHFSNLFTWRRNSFSTIASNTFL